MSLRHVKPPVTPERYNYIYIFCSDNSLCLADELFLPRNTFTFISSSHDTVSWLDHILTTTSGYSLLTDICVKSDFITSDHLPLCFTISVNLNVPISSSANNIPCDAFRYNWYGASDFDISNYYSCTRSELSKIKLPLEAMQCEDVLCNKHRRDIDVFYSAITNRPISRVVIGREVDYRSRLIYVRYCFTNTTLCL